MRSISLRVLIMPAIVLGTGGGIYLLTTHEKGPEPSPTRPPDRSRADRLVEQGNARLAKAQDPAAADWAVQATEAARHFLHAIVADRDHLEARIGAARAQTMTGQLMPAYEHLNFALKIDPTRADLRELRALVAWRIAFEIDGHVPPRPVDLFTLTRLPTVPAGTEVYRRQSLVDLPPGSGRLPLRDAEELFRQGRLDEAAERARASDPRLLERSVLLALIALEKGEDSYAALDHAAASGFAPALMVRARIDLERGHWEKVRLGIFPIAHGTNQCADVWLYRGIAHLKLGQLDVALDSFMKAESIDPTIDPKWRLEAEAQLAEMKKRYLEERAKKE